MSFTGAARLAGVMGWPVAHSRSPALHAFWLAEYGIDGAYMPLAVRPEDLKRALRALPLLGFAGCNITVPYKEAALGAVDEIDETAKRAGAVNTIIVADGRLIGRNSDGFGFLESLHAAVPGWQEAPGPAVVIGAGGAARAVVAALLDARGAAEIRLVNRTAARAGSLAKTLGGNVSGIAWEDRETALAGASLLVNATSLGMAGQPELDLALDALPREAIVHDIVYVPLETPLLTAARKRGNRVVDGLDMLLHQGRPGFAAWFGVMPAVSPALRRAMVATLVR